MHTVLWHCYILCIYFINSVFVLIKMMEMRRQTDRQAMAITFWFIKYMYMQRSRGLIKDWPIGSLQTIKTYHSLYFSLLCKPINIITVPFLFSKLFIKAAITITLWLKRARTCQKNENKTIYVLIYNLFDYTYTKHITLVHNKHNMVESQCILIHTFLKNTKYLNSLGPNGAI